MKEVPTALILTTGFYELGELQFTLVLGEGERFILKVMSLHD
jgi:hypothetical protein